MVRANNAAIWAFLQPEKREVMRRSNMTQAAPSTVGSHVD